MQENGYIPRADGVIKYRDALLRFVFELEEKY